MQKRLANIDGRDVLAVIGLLTLTAGLALLSVPVALIVLGALTFGLALLPLLTVTPRGRQG